MLFKYHEIKIGGTGGSQKLTFAHRGGGGGVRRGAKSAHAILEQPLIQVTIMESGRVKLSLKFALKAEKNPKFNKWFKPSQISYNTRFEHSKYLNVRANHTRFVKSPLSFLTRLLNTYYRAK